eukprot:GHVS01010580.1.p1 GENE.GHVS01010580.1~~GHVS01010580.1.p1  ORF type:complete len:177 (+),score=31.95 GHVS01010580.1:150-680(+)
MAAPDSSLHRLTYFNVKNVAEPIRLTFFIGGIDFEDIRLSWDEWSALKPKAPFGQLPVLQLPNSDEMISQSIGILVYAGMKTGLYPTDPMKAMKCSEVICVLDEIKGYVGKSVHEKTPEIKKAVSDRGNIDGRGDGRHEEVLLRFSSFSSFPAATSLKHTRMKKRRLSCGLCCCFG